MKHIRLFEKDSDYEYYLSGGDNIDRPNVALVKENGRVGYKKKIKRIAKFNVTDETSKTLFTDISSIKSLKINGEEVIVEPPRYEHVNVSFQNLVNQMQFSGDTWVSEVDDSGTTRYGLNYDTITSIPDEIFNYSNIIYHLGEDFDINTLFNNWYLYLCAKNEGQQLLVPFAVLESNMIGLEGSDDEKMFYYDIDKKTLRVSDLALMELKTQYGPFGYDVGLFIADTLSPSTDYIIDTDIMYGSNTYGVSENGEYEAEVEFNSNELPDLLFTTSGKYFYSPLSNLSKDFFDGINNLPVFYQCVKLESLVIPNHIIGEIRSRQFYRCSALSSITLGDGIDRICSQAFYQCNNLTEINATNPDLFLEENSLPSNYINSLGNATEVFLGSTLMKYNGGQAHYVIDGKRVKYIYGNCFSYNRALTSVTITDGTVNIGANAFYNCGNLKTISLPNTLTAIDFQAFASCSGLTEVIIPDSCESIGDSTFSSCYNLSSITLGSGITKIPASCFNSCIKLSSYEIDANITDIHYSAFYNCSGLTSITVNSNNTTYDSRDNCNAIIETATNKLVIGCLGTIIPTSVTTIGSGAFSSTKITTIEIPSNVSTIAASAFSQCYSLTSVTLNEGLNNIGEYAFDRSGLNGNITIPNSVTSIGSWAFSYCSNIRKITFGNGLQQFKHRTFYNCYGLVEVVLPDSLVDLGSETFGNCSLLSSVTLGTNVTKLNTYVFTSCNRLTSITCKATIAPSVYPSSFYGLPQNGILYYPQGSDYSSWMSTSGYYLGYYNWTSQEVDFTESATE